MDLPSLSVVLIVLAATTGLTLLNLAYRHVILPRYVFWTQGIPGPAIPLNILFGNIPQLIKEDPGVPHSQWKERFGPVYQYTGILQVWIICYSPCSGYAHHLLVDPAAGTL